MNEEYLWDKRGEPEPQIKQLEEILGTLRYQPKPLEIPRELVVSRRRRYLPLFAIAATVVIALLVAGIWLRVQSKRAPQMQQAAYDNPQPKPSVVKETHPHVGVGKSTEPKEQDAQRARERHQQNVFSSNVARRNDSTASTLGRREREEALAAKEQLLLALRLASEKLNLAHRKTQSPAPSNQIKNQHRVG